MDKREQMIRLWFSMWLEKKDLGMDDIFAERKWNGRIWSASLIGATRNRIH